MGLFSARRSKKEKPAPLPASKVTELEIVTAKLIRAGFAGGYHAAFHGRGVEFAGVREYQPGDDIRTIEWNVTARTGFPHVKQFVEERDMTILIVTDLSHSMSFGSLDRRKIDLASELIALFAFSAARNDDRTGLVLYGDSIRNYVRPGKGRTHVLSLVRAGALAEGSVSGQANIGRAAEFVGRVTVKRAVIIWISDFLDCGSLLPLRRLATRHDLIALRLTDPREEMLPRKGFAWLTDLETGARRFVDLSAIDLQAAARRRDGTLLKEARSSGIDLVTLSTAIPYERTLNRFFQSRVFRRHQ